MSRIEVTNENNNIKKIVASSSPAGPKLKQIQLILQDHNWPMQ